MGEGGRGESLGWEMDTGRWARAGVVGRVLARAGFARVCLAAPVACCRA